MLASPFVFDLVEATKSLEKICAPIATKRSTPIELDWVRVNALRPKACGVTWRLRNVETGRYLDIHNSVSRSTLMVLSCVSSSCVLSQEDFASFDKELDFIALLLLVALKTRPSEWKCPRPRRRAHQLKRLAAAPTLRR